MDVEIWTNGLMDGLKDSRCILSFTKPTFQQRKIRVTSRLSRKKYKKNKKEKVSPLFLPLLPIEAQLTKRKASTVACMLRGVYGLDFLESWL